MNEMMRPAAETADRPTGVTRGLEATPFDARLKALDLTRDWMWWAGCASPAVLDTVESGVFRHPQPGDALRRVADLQVPDRRAGRRGRGQPARHPQHREGEARPRRLLHLVRRGRDGDRRRHRLPLRRARLPAVLPGAAIFLAQRRRLGLRRDDRGRDEGRRGARPAGADLVLRARRGGARGRLRDEAVRPARGRAGPVGLAHRLHRRPRLRALGRAGRRRSPCGTGCGRPAACGACGRSATRRWTSPASRRAS